MVSFFQNIAVYRHGPLTQALTFALTLLCARSHGGSPRCRLQSRWPPAGKCVRRHHSAILGHPHTDPSEDMHRWESEGMEGNGGWIGGGLGGARGGGGGLSVVSPNLKTF